MKKINFATCITFSFLFFSCTSERKVDILGFAFKGEQIVVKKNGKKVLVNKVEGNSDQNGICYFTEKVSVSSRGSSVLLNIIVDSVGRVVLDTVVTVTNNSMEPFVSLLHPLAKDSYRRSLFIADKTDGGYKKY